MRCAATIAVRGVRRRGNGTVLASALVLFASLPLGSSWAASHGDLGFPRCCGPGWPWGSCKVTRPWPAVAPCLAGHLEDENRLPVAGPTGNEGRWSRRGRSARSGQIYNHGLVGLPGGDEHCRSTFEMDGRPPR